MEKFKIITGFSPASREQHEEIKNSKNVIVKLICKLVY